MQFILTFGSKLNTKCIDIGESIMQGLVNCAIFGVDLMCNIWCCSMRKE